MSIHHFRYRKVTPEMAAEMKKLRRQGLTLKRIAEMLVVAYETVQYHLNDEYRKRHIEQAKERARERVKSGYYKQPAVLEYRKKWNKEYLHERYHNDGEFRKKVIRANKGGKFAEPQHKT